jgi:hypothetical protein
VEQFVQKVLGSGGCEFQRSNADLFRIESRRSTG